MAPDFCNVFLTILLRVPFGIKELHAACGVMITGKYYDSKNFHNDPKSCESQP